jgi:hypothetical protein
MNDNRPGGDNAEGSGRVRHLNGRWRKSSFSTSNGDCVEVAALARGHVGVRDSKAVAGPHLRFSPDAWTTFIGDVRRAYFIAGGD